MRALFLLLALAACGTEPTEPTEPGPDAAEADPLAAPADVAEPPGDAERTASGLASKRLSEGDGEVHPGPNDTVEVHYTGWTTDGEMFDSSVVRGKPSTFPLGGVIPGWAEGLQLMVTGEKRRIWIPEELAYKGKPGRPQGMLVFDVELIDILDPSEARRGPPGMRARPADKEKAGGGDGSTE